MNTQKGALRKQSVYHNNNLTRIACELFIQKETVCRNRYLGCGNDFTATALCTAIRKVIKLNS